MVMNLKFSQLKPSFKMKDIIWLEVHCIINVRLFLIWVKWLLYVIFFLVFKMVT